MTRFTTISATSSGTGTGSVASSATFQASWSSRGRWSALGWTRTWWMVRPPSVMSPIVAAGTRYRNGTTPLSPRGHGATRAVACFPTYVRTVRRPGGDDARTRAFFRRRSHDDAGGTQAAGHHPAGPDVRDHGVPGDCAAGTERRQRAGLAVARRHGRDEEGSHRRALPDCRAGDVRAPGGRHDAVAQYPPSVRGSRPPRQDPGGRSGPRDPVRSGADRRSGQPAQCGFLRIYRPRGVELPARAEVAGAGYGHHHSTPDARERACLPSLDTHR